MRNDDKQTHNPAVIVPQGMHHVDVHTWVVVYIRRSELHTYRALSLQFLPRDAHAVLQAPPRQRRLVTYTMQPLSEEPGHRFGVNRILRLGEDGLLSAGRDGIIRRWDVSSMLSPAGGGGGGGGIGGGRGAERQEEGIYACTIDTGVQHSQREQSTDYYYVLTANDTEPANKCNAGCVILVAF